jgi:tetratricopeptide (TPR) repeat protein
VALAVGLVGTSIGLLRAGRARAAAEAAAAQAKEEAAIADALNQFFVQDLLSAPTPTTQGIDVPMRDVLAVAGGKIEGKFAGQPKVEAQIRKSIGWVYDQLGEPALAEPHLVRALELFERTAGPDDPDTQDTMTRLAGLRHGQGRFAEAAALHEELLRRRRRTLGDDNRLTVQTMSNLGSNYLGMGRFADAEPLLIKAVEGRRRILGPNHPGAYHSMGVLAADYYGLKRREESERLLKETLEGIRPHLGPDHAEICWPTQNLALLYLETGRPREALPTIESALDACRHAWGDGHPFVAEALDTASRIWIALGEWDRARVRLHEMLATIGPRPGSGGLQAANILWLLGRVEAARGRLPEAEPFLQRALALREKSGMVAAPELKFWRACETSVRGDGPAALELLRKAVESGYANPDKIEYAPELKRVSHDLRFESILARARTNRSAA